MHDFNVYTLRAVHVYMIYRDVARCYYLLRRVHVTVHLAIGHR
jgi:hypothetical protein